MLVMNAQYKISLAIDRSLYPIGIYWDLHVYKAFDTIDHSIGLLLKIESNGVEVFQKCRLKECF